MGIRLHSMPASYHLEGRTTPLPPPGNLSHPSVLLAVSCFALFSCIRTQVVQGHSGYQNRYKSLFFNHPTASMHWIVSINTGIALSNSKGTAPTRGKEGFLFSLQHTIIQYLIQYQDCT